MNAALLGLILVAVCLALLWAAQRRLMYFPIDDVLDPAAVGLAGVEAVTFDTSDGLRLGGWFVPAAGTAPRATVLVFNGNAGNRAHRAPLAGALRRRGFHVLLVDYRGYGGNPGAPTEDGLAADARAARRYLANRPDVEGNRLVYLGESLGTGVAAHLATEYPPAAVILRSPFTSMADVGRYHYPWLPVRWLLRDRYQVLDDIGRARAPLLVIAGEADSVVPVEHSRRVYAAADEPKTLMIVPGADHNDLELLAGTAMIEAIDRFVDASLVAQE